jgi:MFS family permease
MLILPALLIPLRDQFGVSITQITSLGTICYFLYGFMALPGGFLADKLSYRTVLIMFFIGTPAAACVVGSAQSVLSLGIGLALLGMFASLYHPSGLAMISHSVRERGKALGLHGMAGNLGLAFSPVIAGAIAVGSSWRYAYYFLSLPGFIAGAVFLVVSRTALRTEQSSTVVSENASQDASQPVQRSAIWTIILLYAAMALTGFVYRGVVTMLPTYLGRFSVQSGLQNDLDSNIVSEGLRRDFQNNGTELSQNATIESEDSGRKWQVKDEARKYTVMKEKDRLNVYGRRTSRGVLFATMVYLVGMMGQYMGGHFSDRRRRTRLYLLFNSVSLPFLILVGLTPGMLVVLIAASFALFHFANQPVENSLVAHHTPPSLRSSSYGLKFFFAFGFGSLGAAFSGYITDHFGFNSVFFALGGVILLIVIVVAFLNVVARESRVETSQ